MPDSESPASSDRAPAESRAEATRNTILDGAEKLFAERGYAGTSMRALADAANTSQALLHHHFGTKAGLYEAVKRRFTERYNHERRPALDESGAPSLDTVADTVSGYFEFLRAHPELARLSAWARLEGDRAPWGGEDEIWRALGRWTENAKQQRLLREDVDTDVLMVLGAAAVQFWFDNRAFICRVLDLDPEDPSLDERYIGKAIDIILFGAAARTDEG